MLTLAGAALAAATLAPVSPVPRACRQLVLSIAAGWDSSKAVLQAYERGAPDGAWNPIGPAFDASLGRAGLAWGRGLHPPGLAGPRKREGDGRSPAGVFVLRFVTGYDESRPPLVRLPYRTASATLRCVDDVRSRFYNQLVDQASVARDWTSAEDMRRGDALYRFVVWVGHNDTPVEPGAGSCIFLHLRSGPEAVTAGCTAFDENAMERLLAWLDPRQQPLLVQLPQLEREKRAGAWSLPPAGPSRKDARDGAAPQRPAAER
jgi:L,D-peptidoglycan transpeptidase YkuD (ErfK/YbiS/YcfS/YnhG family)